MTLTLRAVSLNEQQLTQPITAHFDAKGGTIGRYDSNTLALPDPERHISRRHAEIRSAGTGYTIRNVGSANPIIVRGQPLARGETTTLEHRDQMRIGGYLLEVIDDEGDGESSAITRGRATVEANLPTPSRALQNIQRSGTATIDSGGPFADLLGPSTSPTPSAPERPDATPAPRRAKSSTVANAPRVDKMPGAAGVISASSPPWSPTKLPAAARLPDDFDPFALPPASGTHPEDRGGSDFDDLIPAVPLASIDMVAPLGPGTGDALADFLAKPMPGEADRLEQRDSAGSVSTDPLQALFGTPAPDLPNATARDDTPELRAAYVPPATRARDPRLNWEHETPPPVEESLVAGQPQKPLALPEAGMNVAPNLAEPVAAADTHQLWAAFCEGAGVHVDLSPTPELMRVTGRLLRNAVDGTLRLMAVRRETKQELRAQVTVIRSRGNNPLKFSPDAQVALEQLLKPPTRGFLPGPAAMTDAMHDLVGHSIGTMAGTRAALEGVLYRFAPSELESKLAGRSMLDSVLPMKRKARLWGLYLEKFEAIRAEAKDDFDTLFGKAFVDAYEQQLERLEREKPDARQDADA